MPPTSPRIRVLLVDDHALFRRGVVSLLQQEPDFEIVGEAADGDEAVGRAIALRPDIVLMDVLMPKCDGLTATRRILAALPATRVIMLTVSDDDKTLFDAVRCGAQGYLPKSIAPAALVASLRGMRRGEAALSLRRVGKLMGELRRQAMADGRPADAAPGLTAREQQVLELVVEGKTNKEIGSALTITENTVRSHVQRILKKLHLKNRIQMAATLQRSHPRDTE